jgi:hypothetical protein
MQSQSRPQFGKRWPPFLLHEPDLFYVQGSNGRAQGWGGAVSRAGRGVAHHDLGRGSYDTVRPSPAARALER